MCWRNASLGKAPAKVASDTVVQVEDGSFSGGGEIQNTPFNDRVVVLNRSSKTLRKTEGKPHALSPMTTEWVGSITASCWQLLSFHC